MKAFVLIFLFSSQVFTQELTRVDKPDTPLSVEPAKRLPVPALKMEYQQCSCTEQAYTDAITQKYFSPYDYLEMASPTVCNKSAYDTHLLAQLIGQVKTVAQPLLDSVNKKSGSSDLLEIHKNAELIEALKKPFEKDKWGIRKSNLPESDTLPSECYMGSVLTKTESDRQGRGRYRMCSQPTLHPLPKNKNLKNEKVTQSYVPRIFDTENYPTPQICRQNKANPKLSEPAEIEVRAPCVNNNYIQIIKDSFEEVAKCFDIEARDFFPLINHESNFRLNVLSGTQVGCLGQVTAGTIQTLNGMDKTSLKMFREQGLHSAKTGLTPNELKRMTAEGLNADDLIDQRMNKFRISKLGEKCKKVDLFFNKIDVEMKDDSPTISSNAQTCDLVENPYTCLVYSAMNYARNRDLVRGLDIPKMAKVTIASDPKKKNSKLTQTEMPIFKNFEDIEKLVVLWSYNGGVRIVSEFRTFLLEFIKMVENPKNTDLHRELRSGGISANTFKSYFENFILANYNYPNEVSAARKKEVANFVNQIRKDLYQTEKGIRGLGKCSNIDSPLNTMDLDI